MEIKAWKPNRQQLLNCADWNEDMASKADADGDTQRYERLLKQAARLQRQAEALPKE